MFEDDLPGRLQKAKVAKADRHRFLLAVGIGDYDEVMTHGTSPSSSDTDRDGLGEACTFITHCDDLPVEGGDADGGIQADAGVGGQADAGIVADGGADGAAD